jgi:septation ring formation regulator EzrA
MKTSNPTLIDKTINDLAKKYKLHEQHWNHQDRLRAFLNELKQKVEKISCE